MAHWKDAAVTNEGVEMLNEWMAGRKICVVAAFGGTGTVDKELLTEQTGLVDARQELYILGEEDGADGKTVQLQVQNAEVMEEYELSQVGVYAALDVDKEKASDPETRAKMKLLFIMQDEKGVTIPSAMEASFLLELYCMIGITNNGRFEVSISAAGIVTAAYLREALERTIAAHNADPGAHNSLAARMLATPCRRGRWKSKGTGDGRRRSQCCQPDRSKIPSYQRPQGWQAWRSLQCRRPKP